MSDSCASNFSYSPFVTTAIAAALSAAVASMATAFVMRRRHAAAANLHSNNNNNNNNNAPKALNIDVGVAGKEDTIGLRASLATALTVSSLSQDYPWQKQEFPDVNDDQVSSLREFSRGGTPRHVPSIAPQSHEEQDHECSCNACESCSARVQEPDEKKTREFRPDPVMLPNKRGHRIQRNDSFRSHFIKKGFGLDDSLISLFSTGSDDEDSHPHQRRLSIVDDCTTGDCTHSKHINLKEEESYIRETELKFKGEEGFDESVVSVETDLPDSLRLLRRIRAISALSNRLMAAPDEATCIEEVSRLLVLIFGVERVSFAMLTGAKHFQLKRVNVKRKNEKDASSSSSSFDLEYLDSDYQHRLEGTAAGVCAETLKEEYTPRTQHSRFITHKVFYRAGVNTVLATPILVNGNKCAGCILLARKAEDGYKKSDRVLISDIGLLLGANIYAKRLLKQANESKKRSREMLHSFIPPKVLAKIECYWDSNSAEYKSRKRASLSSLTTESIGSNGSIGHQKAARSNSWYVAQSNWTEADNGNQEGPSEEWMMQEKIRLLKNMNRGDDDSDDSNAGVVVSTLGMNFSPTPRALYAESAKNVCIIFTDIVGFSRMSMDLSPIKVMDMLQNLYSRFDDLCDVHGVLKLETIGDAYICSTNLMEEDDDGVQDAAIRALAMATDMVIEATNCKIPCSDSVPPVPCSNIDTLQIRVGIHVGDVTCGVLGQRMPKFTTCGTGKARCHCFAVVFSVHDIMFDHLIHRYYFSVPTNH